MSSLIQDLRAFIHASPTAFHAASTASQKLQEAGFLALDEREKWALQAGQKYYVVRGGSLCAFHLPKKPPTQAVIVGAHTDSPTFKLKPKPEFQEGNTLLLGVEAYGGPLLSSWLNRDLALAGRVFLSTPAGVEEKLVFFKEAPLFIPQLPIHLDRDIDKATKGLCLNKQDHLVPIAALFPLSESIHKKSYLASLLQEHFAFEELLSYDLFLVPLEESRLLGPKEEMLASYRLDNLASAHACLHAIRSIEPPESLLPMAILWNHEEIGSRTSEGAASPFFTDILERIAAFYQWKIEDKLLFKNRSFCLSVDLAHAMTPHYRQKYEPQHPLYLKEGVVLKHNADYRYATESRLLAELIEKCKLLSLPYQSYVTRSDLPCGSTIGPIFAETTGISTLDIGIAQFSMHSIREVISCQDHEHLARLLTSTLQESYVV